MLVLSPKPLKKLTGTGGQDHVLNQADALTKKKKLKRAVLGKDLVYGLVYLLL